MTPLRQKLFLKVQMRVLPRYGYEGSSSGVYKMMGDMRPFIKDMLDGKQRGTFGKGELRAF